MNLWQKNFMFASLLFTVIIYICVFILAAPTILSTVKSSQASALSEEYAISRALDGTFNNIKKESHKNASASFADNYQKKGIFFEIGSGSSVLFSDLPYSPSAQTGALSWVKQGRDAYICIADQLTSGYYFIYMKAENGVVDTSMKQCLISAVSGAGVILFLCILLYFTLKKINKPIDRLAHELRTPLTVISGYAEALMVSKMTEEQRYYATRYILDESKRLSEVSEKLLTIANLREHKIKKESVDIEDLFIHAQKTYGRVKYTVNWKYVTGDRLLLQSLINNLTANAIKASPEDGVIELISEDGKIIVRDNGKGMSEEQLKYANNPSKKENPSSRNGLGIPLCHEIVRLHKAVLNYTSDAGNGTQATVIFTT